MLKRISESDSLAINWILTQWLFEPGLRLHMRQAKPEEVKMWRQYRWQWDLFYFKAVSWFKDILERPRVAMVSPVANLSRNWSYFVAMPQVVAVFAEAS